LNISDIPYLIKDVNNKMPFHSNNYVSVPYSYKPFPKKAMEESHKVNNKFLNNHLCEIEEAVDKKLMDKTSFIIQQNKYHKESGILNHDNFFHCDLATGTPISNDNFRHSPYLINPYMVSPAGCTKGADLETFGDLGPYGNTSELYFVIQRSDATDGVIGECYDQQAIQSNNTTGNIRLGAYSDDSGDPNALYDQTASIPLTSGYDFKSLTEFELTSVRTWLAFQKDVASQLREYDFLGSTFQQWHKTFTYGSFPDPVGTGYIETMTNAQLRRQKIGHS